MSTPATRKNSNSRLVALAPFIVIGVGIVGAALVLYLGIGASTLSKSLVQANDGFKQYQHNAGMIEAEVDHESASAETLRNVLAAQSAKMDARPSGLSPLVVSPRYPVQIKEPPRIPAPRNTTVINTNKPPTPKTTTLVLVAPQEVKSVAYPEGKAVFVFWKPARPTGEDVTSPDDLGYLVYRAEADTQGKLGKWQRMLEQPTTETTYIDFAPAPGVPYFYAVCQVSAMPDISNAAKTEAGLSLSATTQSEQSASVESDEVTWVYDKFYDDPSRGGRVLDATLTRWFWTRNSAAGNRWIRLTLDLQGIPRGAPLGRKYESFELDAKGTVNNSTFTLACETFDGRRLAPMEVMVALRSFGSGKIDLSTGLSWIDFDKNGAKGKGALIFTSDTGKSVEVARDTHRKEGRASLPPIPANPLR